MRALLSTTELNNWAVSVFVNNGTCDIEKDHKSPSPITCLMLNSSLEYLGKKSSSLCLATSSDE